MMLPDLFSNIQWLPVLVVTILSFALGSFWHSPIMFGKYWKKANNYNVPKQDLNLALIFGGTAVLHFVALAALNAVVAGTGMANGLLVGLFISIVWTFTTLGSTYLFANKSIKLILIDAGMYVVLFSLAGLIFGA